MPTGFIAGKINSPLQKGAKDGEIKCKIEQLPDGFLRLNIIREISPEVLMMTHCARGLSYEL